MRKGEYIDFTYTGGIQTFTIPHSALYKFEVWGSKGGRGTFSARYAGGNGGYAKGELKLKKGQVLTIVCGGITYNGGGDGIWYHVPEIAYVGNEGGGGATHIALANRGQIQEFVGHEEDLLIVAGGGGGGFAAESSQGPQTNKYGGAGGSQYSGTLTGRGANTWWYKDYDNFVVYGDGGGGGGYNGGSAGQGGTSYIKSTMLNKVYTQGANSGNGKVRITLLKKGNSLYGNKEITSFIGVDEISKKYGNEDM